MFINTFTNYLILVVIVMPMVILMLILIGMVILIVKLNICDEKFNPLIQ